MFELATDDPGFMVDEPIETLGEHLSFVHCFFCGGGRAKAPILLLHGTGGDENDLLPLGRMVASDRSLVSPGGFVLENGMPRFFRRLAKGVFDLANLAAETDALAGFVAEARAAYGFAKPIALGFFDGANIAAALMLKHPGALAGAMVLRAMRTIDAPTIDTALASIPVPVLSGAMDPIVPEATRLGLIAALKARGALVTARILPTGHGLSQADVVEAQHFLAEAFVDAR